MKNNLRIVYLGTPDFAVEPLRVLVENQKTDAQCGYEVVGVVTMPDKIINKRGTQLLLSPVKQYAVENNLPLLQPVSLKDGDFLKELSNWNADLQIVVAFRMLPESVWNMPRLGTFNLHASLLPQYRGAAPINWAIINGDKETGVTTFFLKHEIDTGDIIMQDKVTVDEDDTAGTLHDKLMFIGGATVLKTVEAIVNGSVKQLPQELFMNAERPLRPAPKIFRETCRINWNVTCRSVYDFIRGLSPYPSAWAKMNMKSGEVIPLKIYVATIETEDTRLEPGKIVTDYKTYLKVAVKDGFISLLSVQLPGKRRMGIAELMRGFDISEVESIK